MDIIGGLERELKAIPDFILNKICEFPKFAKKPIEAIYFHPDPESGNGIFYLITEGQYSEEFSNQLLDLELNVYRENKVDITLMEWPCGHGEIENQGFFKKLCIYDSKKTSV